MWTNIIIVSTPILANPTHFFDAGEPVGIQAFGAELTVQGLDVRVIRRLSRAREVEHDAPAIRP